MPTAPTLAEAGIDKNLARHLYGDRQWTMQRIAEALNVPTEQTSRPKDGGAKPPKKFSREAQRRQLHITLTGDGT